MSNNKSTRRKFLYSGLAAGAMAGCSSMRKPAARCTRAIGANERINIGVIGCGNRGHALVTRGLKSVDSNFSIAAVCDIWQKRRETYPADVETLFGNKPKVYADYRKLLENSDVDAVIIATPAHQHCGQTIDAVRAGKHIYVEKPIAPIVEDLSVLNKCYDISKSSKMIVQNGSQGVSCPATRAVRKFVAEKKLGKLFRIESTETFATPYWMMYKGPQTEVETNWKAFLYNRKYRPFDAHMHAHWMGYHDFSSGPIGGWMAHFINLVHYVTECDFPVSCTAFGGRYASSNDPRCDAPDNVTVILEYKEGFYTQFVTHFGSEIDHETTIFMFEKGCIKTKFCHFLGNPTYSSEGVDDKIKPTKLLDFNPPRPVPAHMKNWLDCIRTGKQPNANMDYGYKQGIAVLMGDLAYRKGRKVKFDKIKREIGA
ncbi:MAG: Gfo/Idh/MocA family protein [Planctomycetota bacterium]|jgi:predicted dehydrogenase